MHASASPVAGGASLIAAARAFPAAGARRLLVLGGIGLILAGMIFGDIFAVFILHPNADRVGHHLQAGVEAVAAGDAATAEAHILVIGGPGGLLENRGTKVDTHVHSIVFGYIALLLALVLPYVALPEPLKNRLAVVFLVGATLLPICVFLIYYVGLAYSPLSSIGWASILADFGGFLAIVACAGYFAGLWRNLRSGRGALKAEVLLPERSWSGRALLAGGTLLVLAGYLHGAYYAGVHLYEHEGRDVRLLRTMLESAAASNLKEAGAAVGAYGALQGEKAVHLAAHAHSIEFGTLALLLAFVQPFVFLSEPWKRRWAATLLAGSVILPVSVLLELKWGLIAGGIADFGGLLVIIALTAMLIGVLRHSGQLDAGKA